MVDDGLSMDMEDKRAKFEVHINCNKLIIYFPFRFLINSTNKINHIFFTFNVISCTAIKVLIKINGYYSLFSKNVHF